MRQYPAGGSISLALLLLLLILAITAGAAGQAIAGQDQDAAVPPTGGFVARVYYETISDIDKLADYDVWEFNNTKEKYVLVSMDAAIYAELAAQGWRLSLDRQASAALRRNESVDLFYSGYRTVDELYSHLAAVNTAYPALTELVDYGDSYCKGVGGCLTPGGDAQAGHDLLAIRVTNEAISGTSTISGTAVISGSKPVFFLLANIHAREITTPELAVRLLDWLVGGYGADADVTWLVDWHEIWIVPTANPDGHWLVELGERDPYNGQPFFQRKNANRNNGCSAWQPTAYNQYGVDLNRNHGFHWGGAGSSAAPCSQTYRGPTAVSEPEVAALQALIRALIADQRGPADSDPAPADTKGLFITLHSFSKLVLWPWGYTSTPAPNKSGLQALGDKLASFNGYRSCQPGECLYLATGTSDDWAYGELGIPSFTFEVGDVFMPPYGEIDSIQWPQNRQAFLYAARVARAPYAIVQGPDTLTATMAAAPRSLALGAMIDDTQNGGQTIAAASFTIDKPYWISGAISHTLSAADGSFDSASELVEASIDTAALSLGQHTIFVRGQDSDGNWGPVKAIFGVVNAWTDFYFPLIQRD